MKKEYWSNPKYVHCKDHVADDKWPTEEGGKCFKLSSAESRCNHYFDNEKHARELGWEPSVEEKDGK